MVRWRGCRTYLADSKSLRTLIEGSNLYYSVLLIKRGLLFGFIVAKISHFQYSRVLRECVECVLGS